MSEAILVIGGSGFIGKHLVRTLRDRGMPVRAVVSGIDGVDTVPGVEYVEDPGTAGRFDALLGDCRAVVHAASRSTPGESAGKAFGEVQANLVPLLQLLEALQKRPLPLLYLSSGGALYGNEPGDGADESATCLPRSYYGAGKIAAEYFIRAWSEQYGGSAALLRPSNVYGPGQTVRNGFAIIPTAMDKIFRGGELPIWGDGSARRDYLYVDDFVELCSRLVSLPNSAGVRTFNAASGRSVSLEQLLCSIEAVTGRRVVRRFESARPIDAPIITISASKALRELGWRAEVPLEEGLRRTWQWFSNTKG